MGSITLVTFDPYSCGEGTNSHDPYSCGEGTNSHVLVAFIPASCSEINSHVPVTATHPSCSEIKYFI